MKNKKLTIGAIALTAIVVGAGFMSTTLAYRGDPNAQGPNYTSERHEAMEKAFETNDYSGWKELMGDNSNKVTEIVNESNFAKFAEAHELAKNGDIIKSREIRAELGLGQGRKGDKSQRGKGNGNKRGGGNNTSRGNSTHSGFVDVDGNGICDNM